VTKRGLFWNVVILVAGLFLAAHWANAADVTPAKTSIGNGCELYTLCSGEAAATFCGPSTDVNVVAVNSTAILNFSAVGSTGTYTVNLQHGAVGRTALGTNGLDLGTDISAATGMISAGPAAYRYVWANVDSCTACSVTAQLMVCDQQ